MGVENYIPFPAQAVSPSDNATFSATNVDLVWSGLDIDNDIVAYDVYFGLNNPPVNLLLNDGPEELISSVPVLTGKYYWFVVTKDSAGNESESQIFGFRIL